MGFDDLGMCVHNNVHACPNKYAFNAFAIYYNTLYFCREL